MTEAAATDTQVYTPLPDFVVAGFPRCGTSSLWHYLRQHRDVFMPEKKELHFFDQHFDKGVKAWYSHAFDQAKEDQLVGEATPNYATLPHALERMNAWLPDARVILLIRNPVDRAYSAWWMHHSRGSEPHAFLETVQKNLKRIDSEGPFGWWDQVNGSEGEGEIDPPPLVEWGYYALHIKRLWELYPSEKCLVLTHEEFTEDVQAAAQRCWEFIGVDSQHALADYSARQRSNHGLARVVLRGVRRADLEKHVARTPGWFRDYAKMTLNRMGPQKQMSKHARRLLVDHYRSHNVSLSELLDRDLSHWNA